MGSVAAQDLDGVLLGSHVAATKPKKNAAAGELCLQKGCLIVGNGAAEHNPGGSDPTGGGRRRRNRYRSGASIKPADIHRARTAVRLASTSRARDAARFLRPTGPGAALKSGFFRKRDNRRRASTWASSGHAVMFLEILVPVLLHQLGDRAVRRAELDDASI